ncbi:hypothetical protein NVT87_07535 [Acinetobacter radioresistens]|uniref:hypothetical protein n=1 Tax=Acinetobacter radioresistens TaxID=40216 RepID=UPI002246B56C|nr:hypothetical protein [Acinetobacter radioresistens]MCX0330733.1 hypothetical protein [Acinetobacter radioresistens]
MTPEQLQLYIFFGLGIFILLIILLLLHPKSRSKITTPSKTRSSRDSKLANLSNGIELISTPIFWIIKLIIGIFKS